MTRRTTGVVNPMGDDGELDRVYRELDALFADASCPRSTRCCRFRETGRTPYVSSPELQRVLTAVARRGGRLPSGNGEGDCPFLGADGACSIYADRPFGCRTYFCGDATLPQGQRRHDVDALAMRLRALSEGSGNASVVPLTTHLERMFDRHGRRRRR